MVIVCSWCRQEGLSGTLGEKPPLEILVETHGICLAHRLAAMEDIVYARRLDSSSHPSY